MEWMAAKSMAMLAMNGDSGGEHELDGVVVDLLDRLQEIRHAMSLK
jgi:hypothetical protein